MGSPDEWMWLEAGETVAGHELARMCGLTQAELGELLDYGILDVRPGGAIEVELVAPLREAVRVRVRYDLELFTVGLIAQYLHRIDDLERALRTLRGHGPGHVQREGPAPWREPHA